MMLLARRAPSFAYRHFRMVGIARDDIPRYAVLVAGDVAPPGTDPAEKATRYHDYFQLYQNILRSSNPSDERWDQFRCLDGEFPDPSELDSYRGFVISGSRYDAHSDVGWIVRLRDFVKVIYERQHSNLLGICFGHQLLAHALGGESGRAAESGWQLGLQEVQTNDALRKSFPGAPEKYSILKIHQDQVKKLPPGAVCLATSTNCRFEMFSIGKRVLSIQGHPEFNNNLLSGIVQARVKAGTISPDVGQTALDSMRTEQPQSESIIAVLARFLKTAH